MAVGGVVAEVATIGRSIAIGIAIVVEAGADVVGIADAIAIGVTYRSALADTVQECLAAHTSGAGGARLTIGGVVAEVATIGRSIAVGIDVVVEAGADVVGIADAIAISVTYRSALADTVQECLAGNASAAG